MLGGLSDHMEGAQDVASGIAQVYPEYEAMAEAVRSAAKIVMTAYEPEAYGQRENDDQEKLTLVRGGLNDSPNCRELRYYRKPSFRR